MEWLRESPLTAGVLCFGVCLLLGAVGKSLWWLIRSVKGYARPRHRLSRKMSTMSSVLSHGALPNKATGNAHYSITLCCFMKTLPSADAAKTLLQERLLCYTRCRSVPHGNFWKEVDVDLNDHVHCSTVDSDQDLKQAIEKLMNEPIPDSRPRWEMHLIENAALTAATIRHLSPSDAPSAIKDPKLGERECSTSYTASSHCLVFRIDHAISDGVSLVEVLGRLVTDEEGRELPSSELTGLKRSLPRDARNQALSGRFLCWKRFVSKLRTAWKVASGIFTTIAVGYGPYDSDTVVSVPLAQRRSKGVRFCPYQRATWGGPWSFDYIKALKGKLGISVNDILMSAFAGAVRRYCNDTTSESGGNTIKQPLLPSADGSCKKSRFLFRAFMAYAFERDSSVYQDVDRALSNSWTLVSVELPVSEDNALQRAYKTHQITDVLKHSYLPISTFLVNTVLDRFFPRALMQNATWQAYNRHSCVFSSIPGPPKKIMFAGCVIDEMQVLFPNCLPQVEIVTYAGRLFFSVVADPEVIQRPELLIHHFTEELRDLGKNVNIDQDIFERKETCK